MAAAPRRETPSGGVAGGGGGRACGSLLPLPRGLSRGFSQTAPAAVGALPSPVGGGSADTSQLSRRPVPRRSASSGGLHAESGHGGSGKGDASFGAVMGNAP